MQRNLPALVQVTTQPDARNDVLLSINALQGTLSRRGMESQLTVAEIRPGDLPAQHGRNILKVCVFSFYVNSIADHEDFGKLCKEGLAIDDSSNNGKEPNGRYVSVFHPEDTNNAVLFPLDHRSVPAIVHQLTRMPFLALKTAIHPHGLIIQGLGPGMHPGFMTKTGLNTLMPGMLVPQRILIIQQIEQDDRILHLIKLEHSMLGGDLRILVNTGAAWTQDESRKHVMITFNRKWLRRLYMHAARTQVCIAT